MESCPKELEPYDKAHNKKIAEEDRLMHLWFGNYGVSALIVAIDRCFNKKATADYIKNPLLDELSEKEMSQEEIDNKEIQKMILAEETWIKNDKKRGLKETVIKLKQ